MTERMVLAKYTGPKTIKRLEGEAVKAHGKELTTMAALDQVRTIKGDLFRRFLGWK